MLRLCNLLDAVGFDPHQTTSFATMIPLSFTHSRLVKVKAGPSVKPGTYPVEMTTRYPELQGVVATSGLPL